jgi:hypothetical protein
VWFGRKWKEKGNVFRNMKNKHLIKWFLFHLLSKCRSCIEFCLVVNVGQSSTYTIYMDKRIIEKKEKKETGRKQNVMKKNNSSK